MVGMHSPSPGTRPRNDTPMRQATQRTEKTATGENARTHENSLHRHKHKHTNTCKKSTLPQPPKQKGTVITTLIRQLRRVHHTTHPTTARGGEPRTTTPAPLPSPSRPHNLTNNKNCHNVLNALLLTPHTPLHNPCNRGEDQRNGTNTHTTPALPALPNARLSNSKHTATRFEFRIGAAPLQKTNSW